MFLAEDFENFEDRAGLAILFYLERREPAIGGRERGGVGGDPQSSCN